MCLRRALGARTLTGLCLRRRHRANKLPHLDLQLGSYGQEGSNAPPSARFWGLKRSSLPNANSSLDARLWLFPSNFLIGSHGLCEARQYAALQLDFFEPTLDKVGLIFWTPAGEGCDKLCK